MSVSVSLAEKSRPAGISLPFLLNIITRSYFERCSTKVLKNILIQEMDGWEDRKAFGLLKGNGLLMAKPGKDCTRQLTPESFLVLLQ
ncbi:hypothetical protein MHYP_G00011490 [Metynnis hypsauchen]